MSTHKPLRIKWTESAWCDVDGIMDYLLTEGVAFDSVEEYVKRTFKAPEYLSTLPGAGKPGRVLGTREWRVQKTPYSLIYLAREDGVYILRVMHNSRLFPEE